MFFDFKMINFFKPDIVFIPYFYRKDDKSIQRFLTISSIKFVCVLSWEQLFNKLQIVNKTPQEVPDNTYFFAWSTNWKRHLLKSGISGDNIVLTGHPMWSMYWRAMPLLDRRQLQQRNSKIYFENVSWFGRELSNSILEDIQDRNENSHSQINHNRLVRLRKFLKSVIQKRIRLLFKTIAPVYQEKRPIGMQLLTIQEIDGLRTMEKNLLKIIGDLNSNSFSIKMRPSSSKYRDAYLGKVFRGAKLKRGLPLIHYLKSSSHCFVDFSSSGLDAALIGLPTFASSLNLIPKEMLFDWHKLFKPVSNMDGRLLENLYQLDRDELMRYLFKNHFIDFDQFTTINNFLNSLNIQKRLNFLNKIMYPVHTLTFVSWHFLQSIYFFRLILYRFFKNGLDVTTHSQDFLGPIRYFVFKRYSNFFYRKLRRNQ